MLAHEPEGDRFVGGVGAGAIWRVDPGDRDGEDLGVRPGPSALTLVARSNVALEEV